MHTEMLKPSKLLMVDDNKEILLGHITALKDIFTKAEKQLKKEIKEVE